MNGRSGTDHQRSVRMQGAGEAVRAEDLGATWTRHMRNGDWPAAWRVGDRVLASHAGEPCWHLPRHEQWVWDGTPLDGRRGVAH